MKKNAKPAGISPAAVRKIMTEHNLESELFVVEDRRELNAAERRGEITPEEKQQIFGSLARNGKMLNTEDGKVYLEIFGKPEFFMGASDGPVIAGDSRWKTPLFLQYEKLGMAKQTITPSKEWIFRYGNMAEEFVANIGTMKLREQEVMDARYEDCEYGYIWIRYPHVLVHPDGFLVDRKTGTLICLAEVKTANEETPHWIDDFSEGRVPLDYQDQCLIMMEVLSAGGLNIDKCYVLASNKTGDEDGFVQLVVERDTKRAIELLEMMEQFYNDTVAKNFYEDCALLPEETAFLYKEEDKSLGYIELPKKCERIVQQIEDLSAEEEALKEEIAEPLKDLEEIKKQKKLLKSRLYSVIGKAPGGTMQVGTKTYSFKVKRSYSVDKDVKEWAEFNEDPAIREAWEKIKGVKPLISMSVKTVDAAENIAFAEEI